jgi:hypothetical protein
MDNERATNVALGTHLSRHTRKDLPMMTRKPVQMLFPDGRTETLETPPTYAAMRQLVGGSLLAVRVLQGALGSREGATTLYVNEEGFDEDLPRNEAATALHQRTLRKESPTIAAEEDVLVGVALYFEGWTCAEVDAYYQGDNT